MLFAVPAPKEIIEVCRDIAIGGFIPAILQIENNKGK